MMPTLLSLSSRQSSRQSLFVFLYTIFCSCVYTSTGSSLNVHHPRQVSAHGGAKPTSDLQPSPRDDLSSAPAPLFVSPRVARSQKDVAISFVLDVWAQLLLGDDHGGHAGEGVHHRRTQAISIFEERLDDLEESLVVRSELQLLRSLIKDELEKSLASVEQEAFRLSYLTDAASFRRAYTDGSTGTMQSDAEAVARRWGGTGISVIRGDNSLARQNYAEKALIEILKTLAKSRDHGGKDVGKNVAVALIQEWQEQVSMKDTGSSAAPAAASSSSGRSSAPHQHQKSPLSVLSETADFMARTVDADVVLAGFVENPLLSTEQGLNSSGDVRFVRFVQKGEAVDWGYKVAGGSNMDRSLIVDLKTLGELLARSSAGLSDVRECQGLERALKDVFADSEDVLVYTDSRNVFGRGEGLFVFSNCMESRNGSWTT